MSFLILYIIIFCSNIFPAENETYSAHEGRKFLFGFLKNEIDDYELWPYQSYKIATRYDNVVKIYNNKGLVQTLNLQANSITNINATGNEIKTPGIINKDKFIRIEAFNPISVIAYSSEQFSSDAFTIVPIKEWGNEYIINTLGNYFYNSKNDLAPRMGEFLILSNQDNTEINIQLTANINNYNIGDNVTVILNKNESFLVMGKSTLIMGENDLTGTIVTSNNPIGIISGHMRSNMPQIKEVYSDSRDFLAEMVLPTKSWGKVFISKPFRKPISNFYKIVAKENGTQILVNKESGNEKIFLDFKGYSHETIIDENVIWESNKPIQIMQYMARNEESICDPMYDPCVVVLTPIDFPINNTYFSSFNYKENENYKSHEQKDCFGNLIEYDKQYTKHNVSLIMEENCLGDITIDGFTPSGITEFSGNNFDLNGKKYYCTDIELQPGNHTIQSKNGDFNGIVYGTGYADSYAYSLGFSNDIIDVTKPELVFNYTCKRLNITILDTGANNSGINGIKMEILENLKFNGDVVVDDFYQSFYLDVIDVTQNSKLKLIYFDFQNNIDTFDFELKGINPSAEFNKHLGYFLPIDSVSGSLIIKNSGEGVLELDYIQLPGNVSLINPPKFPIKIDVDGQIELFYQINSKFKLGVQKDTINVFFDCDLVLEVPFEYNIVGPGITTKGVDFKNVLIGDSPKGHINITNTGDTDVRLKTMVFEQDSYLQIDTIGLFGKIMEPGTSVLVDCSFSPTERITYSLDYRVIADGLIDTVQIQVTAADIQLGKGVAPLFDTIYYDFGEVLLGDKKTKSFEFKNNGNWPSRLTFKEFATDNISYSANTENNLSQINNLVIVDDKISFDAVFEPNAAGNYKIEAEFTSDWSLHPKITFYSIGTAVNPIIETVSNGCDTTRINYKKSRKFTVFKSVGSSQLYIDNIVLDRVRYFDNLGNLIWLNPNDYPVEPIDFSPHIGKNYNPGDSLEIELTYNSNKEGGYILYFIITHSKEIFDPINEYQETEAQYCFIPIDPPKSIVNVDLLAQAIKPCIEEDFILEINNSGPTDIILNQVRILSNQYITQLDTIGFPYFLKSNSKYQIKGKMIFDLFQSNTLNAEIDVHLNSEDIDTTYLLTKILNIDAETISAEDLTFHYQIDQTNDIELRGKIPYKTHESKLLDFKIKVVTDNFLLHLTGNQTNFTIYNNNFEDNIPFSINQIQDTIIFKPQLTQMYQMTDALFWKFKLPFQFLFSNNLSTELEILIDAENCFLPLKKSLDVLLDSVCIYDYRQFTQIDTTVNINHNKLNNSLEIGFKTYEDDYYQIQITNILGQNFIILENKFANVGENLLYFQLENLPNGNYLLNFSTKYLKKLKTVQITN